MTYGNNPPGGYGNQPEDYRGAQQGGYGSPEQGGYGDPQQGGYGNPQQGGYGGPQQGGYGDPQQGGYGNPQQGGYGNQPGGYANPPGGYASPTAGYGNQAGYSPGGYPPAPGGYGAPAGYGGNYAAPGNYANWGQRVGAYLIDVIPVAILDGIGYATRNFGVYALLALVGLGITAYNRWFQAGKTGQSWGKRALGITLLSEQTGQPIGAGMAFVRDICHFVDAIICYIGFLFPLWDAKRQTLADKIVRTVVVPV
jgi:uncharacterized RDD family membrane protein YckC